MWTSKLKKHYGGRKETSHARGEIQERKSGGLPGPACLSYGPLHSGSGVRKNGPGHQKKGRMGWLCLADRKENGRLEEGPK